MNVRTLAVLFTALLWPAFAAEVDEKPILIFHSGFEGSSEISPRPDREPIIGRDDTLPPPNDWVGDLQEKVGFSSTSVEYTGGTPDQRFAKITPEPGNPKNHVLWFWLNDSWPASEKQIKARIQVDFYGRKKGFAEFYQSVRLFLPDEWNLLKTYPQPIKWCTISEFWNDTYWGRKNGFRISLGIGKPTSQTSDLNFILDAQDSHTKSLWMGQNEKVKVPIGRWFTMEYYYKEGDDQTGRFFMAITPEGQSRQVVYDLIGWTRCPTDPAPAGITDWNPMKLYTSKELVAFMKEHGKPLEVYWDDFELWENRRPVDSTPVRTMQLEE